MKLQDILKIKSTSQCIVHHELTENWKNCYYQLKGDESINNGEIVSKFEEKYNESGWGELGNDHEPVFDPTKEVFEDSSLTTIHKREYESFILMIQIKIKEYLSLDESKGFEEFDNFINWIEVSGHYAVQDLFEKIDCFTYEITTDKPDDKYLWFSHYELSSDYSKIWIEEIIENESIDEVKEPFKENDLKSKEGYNKSLEKEDELKLKLVEKYPEIYKDYKEGKFTLELLYKRASHKQNIEKKVKKLNEDIKSGKYIKEVELKLINKYPKLYQDYKNGKHTLESAYLEGLENDLSIEKTVFKLYENIKSSTSKNGLILRLIDKYPKLYKDYENGKHTLESAYLEGLRNDLVIEKKYKKLGEEMRTEFSEFKTKTEGDTSQKKFTDTPEGKLILDKVKEVFKEDLGNKLEEENEVDSSQKKFINQGGCLVVILFLLSLTLSLII